VSSSSMARISDEQRVVLSSLLVLIHLGGVTMWVVAIVYAGLQAMSSWWTVSASRRDLGPWFIIVCVLTLSIWILNQCLSSKVLVLYPWFM